MPLLCFCWQQNRKRSFVHYKFALKYAAAQILPSVIWMTKDASKIARSMGYAPSVILRTIKSRKRDDAKRLLRVQTLEV